MDVNVLRAKAIKIFQQEKLAGWRLVITNRFKTAFGKCNDRDKIILLNEYYANNAPEKHVMDTLLHEVAHAVVGCECGHNAVWRAAATRLGCTPKACCSDSELLPPGKYEAKCSKCSRVYKSEKKPRPRPGKQFACIKPCNNPIFFTLK